MSININIARNNRNINGFRERCDTDTRYESRIQCCHLISDTRVLRKIRASETIVIFA